MEHPEPVEHLKRLRPCVPRLPDAAILEDRMEQTDRADALRRLRGAAPTVVERPGAPHVGGARFEVDIPAPQAQRLARAQPCLRDELHQGGEVLVELAGGPHDAPELSAREGRNFAPNAMLP